jgi:hypothetical protein
MTNPQSPNSDILHFTEKVDVKKCQQILKLNYNDFQKTFWSKDEIDKDGGNWKLRNYHKQVTHYCIDMINNKGVKKMKYKYGASGNGSGRIYSANFGIQNLQSRLRNFLIDGIYKDIDIRNCHPTISYDLCKQYKIRCPLLEEYVTNRNEILDNEKLSKFDILMTMYNDKQIKTTNAWLILFGREMTLIKHAINDNNKKLYTESKNINNKHSSIFNRILSHYENIIIQNAMKEHKSAVAVPMFDGFLIDINYELDVESLTMDESSIQFIEKPFINYVELESDSDDDSDDEQETPKLYKEVKKEFEKTHFMIKSPLCFLTQIEQEDGDIKWDIFKEGDFTTLTAPYKFFDPLAGEKEDPIKSFFKKWIEDPKRRCFDKMDFIPYNVTPPKYNKKKIYNLFEPFKRDYIKKEDRKSTKIFYDLLFELCGTDKIAYDYFIKYIAHIIQFPNERPEVIPVMRGAQGVGKDTLIDTIERLLSSDKYCFRTENMDDIFGNFNEPLHNRFICQFNETEGKDAVRNVEKLKGFATRNTNSINMKNKCLYITKNYFRIFIVSNNKTPVLISPDDRRYFIIKSTNKYRQDADFFTEYYKLLSDDNFIDSLYSDLMDIDLSKVDIRVRPKTEQFEIMKNENLKPIHHYLKYIVEKTEFDEPWMLRPKDENQVCIKPTDFYMKYKLWLERESYDVNYFKQRDVLKELESIDHIDVKDESIKYKNKCIRVFIFNRSLLKEHLFKEFFTMKVKETIEWN